MRCIAHIINLACQAAVKSAETIVCDNSTDLEMDSTEEDGDGVPSKDVISKLIFIFIHEIKTMNYLYLSV